MLARPSERAALAGVLFAETPTLGVRHQEVDRVVLERELRRVDTPVGRIAVNTPDELEWNLVRIFAYETHEPNVDPQWRHQVIFTADDAFSGSLTEMKQRSPRQVRLTTQKLRYYKLTMEVTDLETSLIAWTTEREFARQLSEPIIGW